MLRNSSFKPALSNLSIAFLFAALFFSSCSHFVLQQVDGIPIRINEEVASDSIMLAEIQPYKDSLATLMEQVIGHSSLYMDKGFPESLLGNFVADLMLEMTSQNMGIEVDFALTNNGGLRVSLPEGEVRLGKIYELMPFENEIILLELNPEIMQQLLLNIASGEKMSVAGIRMVIKNDSFDQVEIGGKAYDPAKSYRLATTDYLANGGSGMGFLEEVSKREIIGIRLRDMIIEYIKLTESKGEQISSALDGRIRIHE